MPILNFKGKTFVQNHHLAVKFHELIPDKDKSLTDKVSLEDNLIIHGDNLSALKSLLPNFAGRIKCIYIDPPYNTGNENWKYNDNVNSPMMQEWLGQVVDKEDLTRHDKWLCMMMPRLKLLKELLSDDGVIFVSIDDNEVHNLRGLMDEVFGENNFIATVIWEKKFSPQNDAKWLSDNHDYIVIYAKDKEIWRPELLPRTEEANARYSNPDNDPRGNWTSGDLLRKDIQKTGLYTITTPSGRECNPPSGTSWRIPEYKYDELLKDNRLWFGANGDGVPRIKRFLSEVKGGMTSLTIWKREEVGDNQSAKRIIKEIFNESEVPFDTPKSVELIEKILKLSTKPNEETIILDSFAGSGTTAHAVLSLNKEDGGNRKFILVECEEYANEITAERVRRVIKGVPAARDENLKVGLGGKFSYFKLGEPIEIDKILSGEKLPTYENLARYIFYTATGQEFKESLIDEKTGFIGETEKYQVYLLYKPDVEYLRTTALNLDKARDLRNKTDKRLLIFAPMKYLDIETLDSLRIDFCQLPYEIYKIRG